MVAGIFEKSKRLRKAFFLDIQETPNLSGAIVPRARLRNVARNRAGITVKTPKNQKTRMGPQGQDSPQAPIAAHGQKLELYRSAPVCKACSVSPALRNSCRPNPW